MVTCGTHGLWGGALACLAGAACVDVMMSAARSQEPKNMNAVAPLWLPSFLVERFGGGQQFDPHQLPDELFAEQAERRVRLGILLGATVKKLGLAADPDRVRALIDEMAAAYDDAEQVVNFYYSNDENLKQVEALAVEEQVAEKLLESAKAKTIDMSYADVMKSRQS